MKKNSFFWPSYADLMTSLFFVMLVLFVLAFSLMRAKLSEFEKIEEIKAAVNNLNPAYFRYDSANKRHELKVNILFQSGKYDINHTIKNELIAAGEELKRVIDQVSNENEEVKYAIIIEGMAARYVNNRDLWRNKNPQSIENTYILSYNRAKELYKLWKSNGIDFNPDICEIIIAGSGWFGAGRYEGKEEGKNKRFLIQIIPKIGNIE